jgi:hypothetical protein
VRERFSVQRSIGKKAPRPPSSLSRASSGQFRDDGCCGSRDAPVLPAAPPAGVLPIWRRPSGASPNQEWMISGLRGIARSRKVS